jgi:hypothetical protein
LYYAGTRIFRAEAIPGSVKYGQQDLQLNLKGIDQKIAEDLGKVAGHSIARKTWSTYRTAERMLATFLKEEKIAMNLPISEETTLKFVHWLMFNRGLSAPSISGYLAGVKKLHVIKGLKESHLRTELVQMVLEGKKNIEAAARQLDGKKRQPMTPEIMGLLKARIKEWNTGNLDKLTVWAVSSLMFHGAFRSGELLAKNVAFFDPAYTLLRRDILLSESEAGEFVVQILVKAPKESKNGSATVVDIFKTDTDMCPARAVKKWWNASRHLESDQPAFRLSCGSPLTGAKFNSLLHGLVSGHGTRHFRPFIQNWGGIPNGKARFLR